jgi:glycine/D-amino acid oxidase-like deaminating enzyme
MAGVRALEAALRDTVDEVGRVIAAESIPADFVRGGRLSAATTPSQLARVRAALRHLREHGDGKDIYEFLGRDELAGRIAIDGGLGGLYAPHSARIQPAALAAGLAEAAERRGVEIYEATPVTEILPAGAHGFPGNGSVTRGAVARTVFGDVRASAVLRCTEGFTSQFPGQRRTLLPMNSSMVVTEPLPEDVWRQIGWDGCETLADEAHAYVYAQRTSDGRIAIGGRGVPYRFGSGTDHRGATDESTARMLRSVLERLFPAASGVPLAHAWCGVLGVPRDWCASVTYHRASGTGWAGGYTGHGVAAANLAGRTLASLVTGEDSELTTLPWVGHPWRSWEPEPARWTGVRGLYSLYRLADRFESDAPADRPARVAAGEALARVGNLISGNPH